MKSKKLLFKNGFKQLFQFKFSLIAILILAMIGALVVSTSITTIKKLNKEFNGVVNNQEKFSDVYENESLVGQNSDFSFLPIVDLLDKKDSISAFKNFNDEVQSSFNIDLTNKDTFVGDYFASEQFKKIFPFLLTFHYMDTNGLQGLASPFSKIRNYYEMGDTNINEIYPTSFNQYFFFYFQPWAANAEDIIKKEKSSDVTWFEYAVDLFFNTFVKNIPENSMIGQFTKLNPNWFKPFVEKHWSENLGNVENFNPNHFETYKYVHYSLSTLLSQIMYMSDEFLTSIMENGSLLGGGSIGGYNDKLKYAPYYSYQYIFGVDPKYSKDVIPDEVTTNKTNFLDNNNTHIANISFIDEKGPRNFFEIKNDPNELFNFKTQYDPSKDGILEYEKPILPEDFSKMKMKEYILKNGYKGQLNPQVVIKSTNPEEFQNSIIPKNDFKSLQGIGDGFYFNSIQNDDIKPSNVLSALYQSTDHGKHAESEFGIDFNHIENSVKKKWTLTDGDLWDLVPFNESEVSWFTTVYNNPTNHYYKYHVNLAADLSKMNLSIRDEVIYSDIVFGKKYRLITMSSLKNSKFNVLDGIKPNRRGEVAVGVQYAKYNDVKVGDLIKIGNANLAVVGIATDTFTFYPTVDPLVPVPKPKTSGIFYMQDETMLEIFKNDSSQMDLSSFKQSVYLYSKSNEQKNDFLYNLNLSNSQYYQNYINKKDNVDQVTSVTLKSFDNSVESRNWTVYEKFMKVFSSAIIWIMLVIMLAISIMLYLVIRKSIQLNIDKIAILISLGYRPKEISLGYLWYGICMCATAIPLGWLLGTFLQIPIQILLQDFFTFDSKHILFSWEALLVGVVVIGIIFGIGLTILVAVSKMSKPYIQLINENNIPSKNYLLTFIKTKIIKNTGFKRRLAFDVASSSSKNLILMGTLIGISSFLISTLVFIPSVALTTKSKYFENVKYKNEFKLNDPITNDPLSKRNINFWEGPNGSIKNMIDINYEIGKTKDTRIMNSINGYKGISSNSTLLPELLYSPKKDSDSKPYIRTSYEDIVRDNSDLVSIVYGAMTYNFHNPNGKSLSIGMFDQVITEYMNEYLPGVSIEGKAKAADKIIRIISGALPTVLQMVDMPNMDFTQGDDWKQVLLRAFTTKAPSFIKEFIGVKERQSSINFGFNTINVVPTKDSLGTDLKVKSDVGNLQVIGVDRNQTAFEIPNKSYNDLFASDKHVNELYKYINGEQDKLSPDNNLLDKTNNTITIPIIANQHMKLINKMNVGNTINNINAESKKYVLNTPAVSDFVIPNIAWKYDDTDFYKSDYYKQFSQEAGNEIEADYTTDENGRVYKNPYRIDPNKVSYKNLYTHLINGSPDQYYDIVDLAIKDQDIKLKNNAYMFGDFLYGYNKQGNTEIKSSYVRPYYNFRNFKLFIPTSLITKGDKGGDEYKSDLKKFVLNNGGIGNTEALKHAGWIDDGGNVVTSLKNEVPKDTIAAYKNLGYDNVEDWVMIKPYDLDPYHVDRGDEQFMHTFSSAYTRKYWLNEMMLRNDSNLVGLDVKQVPNANGAKDVKFKFKVIDIMDTYSGVGLITNSDLLNLLIQVENNKQTIYDHSRLDKNKWVKEIEGIHQYRQREFSTYNKDDWEQDSYLKGSKEDINKSIVNDYSNSVYSNIIEPLQITTGVSMQTQNGSSTYSMHDDFGMLGISIEKILLLEEQKEVIDQLFKLTMYISLIFITIILLIVIIIILISSDIYLSRLRMFIVSLKAFGYTKREISILLYSISFVTVLFAIGLGFLISWGFISGMIGLIIAFGLAIPFVVSPFVPLITFSLMLPIWVFGSFTISNKILNLKPIDGFNTSN